MENIKELEKLLIVFSRGSAFIDLMVISLPEGKWLFLGEVGAL